MIDSQYKVRRYVSEFSNHTDELLAEYELDDFDLLAFQQAFNETDKNDPMYACYLIAPEHLAFLADYLSQGPANWDFKNKSYFVEAHGLD